MLLGNYNIFNVNPGRGIGGPTDPTLWQKPGSIQNFYIGWHVVPDVTTKSGFNHGYLPGDAFSPPMKAGGVASTSSIQGLGSVNYANLAGGLNATANLSGSGAIITAQADMLGFAIAALAGLSDLSADVTGKIEAAASLAGAGSVTAALGLLSNAVCSILGAGALNASVSGILDAQASLSGSGNLVANATALLEVLASLSGSGAISANVNATLAASAGLSGSGDLVVSVQAIANMVSSMVGSGTLTVTMGAIPAYVSADISVLAGEITNESLAAAVWNALAASFDNPLSMGSKMNDASAGGNPWDTAIEGATTAGEILKLLAAVSAGKTYIVNNPDGSKTIKFRDLDDTKDRVGAEVVDSERINVTLDLT